MVISFHLVFINSLPKLHQQKNTVNATKTKNKKKKKKEFKTHSFKPFGYRMENEIKQKKIQT